MPLPFRVFLLTLALLTAAYGLLIHAAYAADATVSWTPATQYADGAPMPASDIRSHVIEWSPCLAGDQFGELVGDVAVLMPATETTVTGFAPGRWCFRAYTMTVAGQRSEMSDTAAKTITSGIPGAPTLVEIDIQITGMLEPTAQGLRLVVR